jgi:hypothetical protein
MGTRAHISAQVRACVRRARLHAHPHRTCAWRARAAHVAHAGGLPGASRGMSAGVPWDASGSIFENPISISCSAQHRRVNEAAHCPRLECLGSLWGSRAPKHKPEVCLRAAYARLTCNLHTKSATVCALQLLMHELSHSLRATRCRLCLGPHRAAYARAYAETPGAD